MTLLEEFNERDMSSPFEIEIDGEFYIYYIDADERGLHLGGVTNCGFHPYDLESVEWDDTFGLYEHLQELYEIAYTDAQNKGKENEI